MSEPLLQNRDYTVIVAKTAPNPMMMPPGYEKRWSAAHSAIVALAQKCEEFDPDGVTIYISCKSRGGFVEYRNTKSDQIQEIFAHHYPPSELDLLDGLQLALNDYFDRKSAGKTKANGAIMIVLIDGEPKDRMAIAQTIVKASQQVDRDEELGIGFAQIGDDLIAKGFLNALDNDLRTSAGARFDIVSTRSLAEIGTNSLTEFLLDVIRK